MGTHTAARTDYKSYLSSSKVGVRSSVCLRSQCPASQPWGSVQKSNNDNTSYYDGYKYNIAQKVYKQKINISLDCLRSKRLHSLSASGVSAITALHMHRKVQFLVQKSDYDQS